MWPTEFKGSNLRTDFLSLGRMSPHLIFVVWFFLFLLFSLGERLFGLIGNSPRIFLSMRLQSSYLKSATFRLGVSLAALIFLRPVIVLLFVVYCQGVDTISLCTTLEESKRSFSLAVFVSEPLKKLFVVRFIIYYRYRMSVLICIIFYLFNSDNGLILLAVGSLLR